ncbi:MAG: Gfo/Idh/MocA family oxidoreductase [Deltaproteobacteria bacterium]|jgi:predicted dehydrogenase|nr:Gfo/Idh/MocA family oxidoreductase [Deltaproteobacteria bacterium]
MKLAVIGCGLIGNKRAEAMVKNGLTITCAADIDFTKAQALCARHGGTPFSDPLEAINSEADIVNVAVTHDQLSVLALAAIEAGKHVLLEKPGARCAAELAPVAQAASKKNLKVKVGYNHRFHPSLLKARELVDSGALGPLMYVRGRYGHGGRLGYEREWRMDAAISGGGELVDQGSHLIDLAGWFLGDFTGATGQLPTYFWPAKVEDNAFMLLTTEAGNCAMLHATWTEWRNMFSFEIYGRNGKIAIDGLGGSYGTEQLAFYRMLPGMGPPETTVWQYPFPDCSWELETMELVSAIREGREPIGGVSEALKVLEVIGLLYAQKGGEIN